MKRGEPDYLGPRGGERQDELQHGQRGRRTGCPVLARLSVTSCPAVRTPGVCPRVRRCKVTRPPPRDPRRCNAASSLRGTAPPGRAPGRRILCASCAGWP